MAFSLSALAAVFYPIGRRFSEWLATGYVIFRGALEGMVYVISTLIWLVLLSLSSQPTSVALNPIARVLLTANDVIWNQLVSLPFGVGALMFYVLLHRARLVPSWILIWGYVSVALFSAANLAHLFGVGSIDIVMFSLLVQEMVLAGWLIVKGFDPEALEAAPVAETPQPAPARPTMRPAPVA